MKDTPRRIERDRTGPFMSEQPTTNVPNRAPRREWLNRLRAEQAEHWRLGERVLIEAIMVREPDLAADTEALLDLIYSEIMLCEQYGERPEVEEYVLRFPQHEAALRRQFAVHEALRLGEHLRVAVRRPQRQTWGAEKRKPLVPLGQRRRKPASSLATESSSTVQCTSKSPPALLVASLVPPAKMKNSGSR